MFAFDSSDFGHGSERLRHFGYVIYYPDELLDVRLDGLRADLDLVLDIGRP